MEGRKEGREVRLQEGFQQQGEEGRKGTAAMQGIWGAAGKWGRLQDSRLDSQDEPKRDESEAVDRLASESSRQ